MNKAPVHYYGPSSWCLLVPYVDCIVQAMHDDTGSFQGSQKTGLLVAALSSYILSLVLASVTSCMSICCLNIAIFAVCHPG